MQYYFYGYNYASLYRLVYNKTVKFGISQKIWNMLKSFKNIDVKNEQYYFKPISNEETELFADGTIIFIN